MDLNKSEIYKFLHNMYIINIFVQTIKLMKDEIPTTTLLFETYVMTLFTPYRFRLQFPKAILRFFRRDQPGKIPVILSVERRIYSCR